MGEGRIEVVRLGPVTKHENADTLAVTSVNGYPVVFRLDEYHEGDLAVYVPVDSIVPESDTRWEFLAGHRRIKAKRLRGVFSMGLLTPTGPDMVEGDDVGERMGITRYDPEVAHVGIRGTDTGAESAPFQWPVYDIEALRRWGHVLELDEPVQVTEKIHGCVPANARIMMADGSQRRYNQIEPGEYVMGADSDGRPCASRVIRKYENGVAVDGWLRISGSRTNAGRGNSFFALRCTPDHRIWCASRGAYVEAKLLVAGDRILSARTDPALSPLQRSVLLGKLLGDGYLHDSVHTASVVWGHREHDAAYMEWTARAIGDLAATEVLATSGYGSEMRRQRTAGSAFIKEAFSSFYAADQDKRVPEWVANALDPIAMAFWYMDDGSLGDNHGQEDRANFAVCAFSEADCAILQRGLLRFGIESVFCCYNGFSRLRLNAESAERLFLLVAPYIPPCMQRKLPLRYRGHEGWLPREDSAFKPMFVEQTIDAIVVDETTQSRRYDMETETHNYFAYGVLVHNCNGRFVYRDGRLWVGSRNHAKKPDPASLWWQVAEQYDLEAKLAAQENMAVYGEVYGQVQDLKYGTHGIRFAVFDVLDMDTMRWLAVREVDSLVKHLGLERVPELYRGPWDPERATEWAEGHSTLASHVREGFVVKPMDERTFPRIGRVILKMHGQGYLLRKETL